MRQPHFFVPENQTSKIEQSELVIYNRIAVFSIATLLSIGVKPPHARLQFPITLSSNS